MNKQSMYSKKTFFRNSVLALAIAAGSLSAKAQSAETTAPANENIAVRYMGTQDNMMIIGVQYNNAAGSRFNLSIYSEDGDVLFRDIYTDKTFDKKFKIPREHGKINFIIGNLEDRTYRSYEVSNSTRVVEDVIVKRVD